MATTPIASSFGLLRWPFLVNPRVDKDNADRSPQFACTFVAGGPNGLRAGDQEFLAALMKQMDEVCQLKWGMGIEGKRAQMMSMNKVFNLALKRNSDPSRMKHAGIGSAPAGFHFEAKTKFAPDLFDPHGGKLTVADPTMFYDGAVARTWVSAFPYEHPKSGPGIGLNLHGVQFVQHAPRLGGAEIKVDAVDPGAVPADLPSASAPAHVSSQQNPPAYGQGDNNPPAANAGASYGAQNPPAGGGGGGGFGF